MAPLERAIELTPILAELGYDDKYSFNGLLQVTTDGKPSIGGSSRVRGLCYAEAVWGPNARTTIQKFADEPEAWTHENFPFAALRELQIQYFADVYPVKAEPVGYKSLYDPKNLKPRS